LVVGGLSAVEKLAEVLGTESMAEKAVVCGSRMVRVLMMLLASGLAVYTVAPAVYWHVVAEDGDVLTKWVLQCPPCPPGSDACTTLRLLPSSFADSASKVIGQLPPTIHSNALSSLGLVRHRSKPGVQKLISAAQKPPIFDGKIIHHLTFVSLLTLESDVIVEYQSEAFPVLDTVFIIALGFHTYKLGVWS
jgi:hypothetical protein